MPQIVHWNPRLRLREGGVLSRVSRIKRENNFGDLLGPRIVERICEEGRLGPPVSMAHRLLTVGSIINTAGEEGDIIWGSGIHGNLLPLSTPLPLFDVRAVRGPLTAEILRESGNDVPEVFGDPGLLVPHLWSDDEFGIERGSRGTVFVPNYYDMHAAPPGSLNPRGDFRFLIREIASASKVIASSLHAIVIAEAYNVPAVLVASTHEKPFKYEDYYRGTGRRMPAVASDWRQAQDARPTDPMHVWDPGALLDAFPADLWFGKLC